MSTEGKESGAATSDDLSRMEIPTMLRCIVVGVLHASDDTTPSTSPQWIFSVIFLNMDLNCELRLFSPIDNLYHRF